jgi:vancomycin resistance protein YoaR
VRRDALVATALAVACAALTAAATLGHYRLLPDGRALPGTFVGDRVQPDGVGLGDWLEQRRQRLRGRRVILELAGEYREMTLGELGIELDVGRTMQSVADHAERGGLGERLYRAWDARRARQHVPLEWSFDRRRARTALEALAPVVWRDPVDARLDLAGHRRIDDEPGRALDVEQTLAILGDASREQDAVIPVATREVAAAVRSEMLASVDVSRVLSAWETDFGGTGRGRAQNIRRAAELLDGTMLLPGRELSFNALVGERTLQRGFTWAPVIKGDELEPGVGGGTCQVASTLHAAAVYGGLEVPRRRSHSRPSGYVPLGLDATVVWGEVDLAFRNPYDAPLILHAFLPTPRRLRIELLGRDAPSKVEHVHSVVRSHEFFRRVTTKPWLTADRKLKKQKGIRGYEVVSLLRIHHGDGRVAERRWSSEYRPVPEVWWVGPGFQLEQLPEMPEGAVRLEIDGRDSSELGGALADGRVPPLGPAHAAPVEADTTGG